MASPEDPDGPAPLVQQASQGPIERRLRAELEPPSRWLRRLRLLLALALLTALSAASVALLVTLVRLLGPWRGWR